MLNEDDVKRPLVPLKVGKARLELPLGTIPVRVRSVRSNSDNKADSVQLNGAGTELGNNIIANIYIVGVLVE